jgi:hypothetical protein
MQENEIGLRNDYLGVDPMTPVCHYLTSIIFNQQPIRTINNNCFFIRVTSLMMTWYWQKCRVRNSANIIALKRVHVSHTVYV